LRKGIAMKIGNPIDNIKPDGVNPGASCGGTSSTRPVSPTEASDRINLSETSRTLASGETRPVEEIRADKVNVVRVAIARGEYRVDSEVVAERLIMESAQLLETLSSNGKGVGQAGAPPATDGTK